MVSKIKARYKLVAGVGINDADYCVNTSAKINGKYVKTWRCPYYEVWRNMLTRCYSTHNTSYVFNEVCEEWHTFSNFKSWMETQDWEGKDLDKDLLIKGNKVYSEDACMFIPPNINKFLQNAFLNKREGGVKGYYFDSRRNKYTAQCSDPFTGKLIHCGCFNSENEANLAWLTKKHEYACQLAELQSDPRVSELLRNFYKSENN